MFLFSHTKLLLLSTPKSFLPGFGSALEKWANSSPIDNTNTEFSSRKEPEIQHSLDAIFSVLAPYLDVWDDRQAQDAAESEFVELFDESASLGGAFRNDQGSMMLSDAVSGSETAADSMSSYIGKTKIIL